MNEVFSVLVFVGVCLLWVAPFAINTWKQVRRERSKANHPTARKS
jgi:hypothetical protein